jgi:protein gp37
VGEDSKIEWTDHTFNAWVGCEKVSPACDHCYAERGSARLGAQHGLKLWGGDRFFTGEEYWKQPARWNRAASRAGVIARVFTNSYGDIMEDRRDLDDRRVRLATVVRTTRSLLWLFLTKRIEVAQNVWAKAWWDGTGSGAADFGCWPSNVALGTTVEDIARKSRIDILRSIPARTRFLSIEPLLEDLGELDLSGIHQVIVGGESGSGARPFAFEWAENIRAQCERQGAAFFMKQGGSRPTLGGRLVQLRSKKGGDLSELPERLRVREFPTVQEAAR